MGKIEANRPQRRIDTRIRGRQSIVPVRIEVLKR